MAELADPMIITSVIFDFGGVLIEWNPRNLYRHFFARPEEMEAFLSEIGFGEWNAHQDRGRPFAEGVAELSARFPQHAALIEAYRDRWEESVGRPIAGTIEILREVKARGYSAYGLSNWSSETFPLIRTRYDFFDLLDGYLISGDARLTKPDPAIYQVLLDQIHSRAAECIFIDDSSANVETARELGFVCILFESPAQLQRELMQIGII